MVRRLWLWLWNLLSSGEFWKHPLVSTFIGSFIIALAINYISLKWTSDARKREIESEERSRKIELFSRTINQGESSLSVLESYLDIHYWMKEIAQKQKQSLDVSKERFNGMEFDKVMERSVSIYALYIQTPKIQSIMKDIEFTFASNAKIKALATDLANAAEALENQDSTKAYQEQMKWIRHLLKGLIAEMERDLAKQKG